MIKTKTYFLIITLLSLTFTIYHFESKVDSIKKEIDDKRQQISQYQDDIRVYQAEWSYQLSPKRLSKLASKMDFDNSLKTPQYRKFSNLDNLPKRNSYFSKNQY
jgi:hypothetical protein